MLSNGELDDERRSAVQMVLVCAVGEQRIGIPLALVARLEEVDPAAIELAGGREVIQYRDRLLHLVRVADALGFPRGLDESEQMPILVHETEFGLFGFAVDAIVDVFEADLASAEPSHANGLAMSGVIGHRVTDLLDIDSLVSQASPPLVNQKGLPV